MKLHLKNPIRILLWIVGTVLIRIGLIDAHRARRTTALAWPRIITGLARVSKSAADIAMVGLVLGPAAIAGIGFASPFIYFATAIGGGVAGGTISLVSQRYGAGQLGAVDLAIKQSAWVAIVLGLPFAVIFWVVPETLLSLLTVDAATATYGAVYLQIVGITVVFMNLNFVASRALVGADDARTPMIIRSGGALINIALNIVFIFGLGLGVLGAALGTLLAEVLVTLWFAWGFIRGNVVGAGRFPICVSRTGPYIDVPLIHQLLAIATPLMLTGLAATIAQFPLIAIVGLFGSEVVAAFVIAQRVRGLMDTPGWGFGLASSSLVGQYLGTGNEFEAGAYGRDIFRFAVMSYLLVAVVVFVFAEPIGRVFVSEPPMLPLVTVFIQIATISVIWNGVNSAASGPLTASGDTRWPLYGQLVGLYLCAIPLAYLGAVTSLGIAAVYCALVVETMVPALVSAYRFRTGHWKVVSRSYRPAPAGD